MKTDIIEQKEFNLLTEKNDIVITNNVQNDLVKQLDKIFGGKLIDLSNEPFTTIHTLGKLKSKRVHIVNLEKLDKLKNALAVGDGANDVKMIEMADIGIAMSNTRFEELKEKAKHLAPHIKEDQLYDFFKCPSCIIMKVYIINSLGQPFN